MNNEIQEDLDTIQYYSPTTKIPDGCFEMFQWQTMFGGNIEHISNKQKANFRVCVFNKDTPIIVDKQYTILIRITDIPNTNHKLVFKASKELADDLLEYYELDIEKEWDIATKKILDKVSI